MCGFSFIEPLSKLTRAFGSSLATVSWLMVMCMLLIYAFAVMCTQECSPLCAVWASLTEIWTPPLQIIGNDSKYAANDTVQGKYGTVSDSMWTLTVKNLELPDNSAEVSYFPNPKRCRLARLSRGIIQLNLVTRTLFLDCKGSIAHRRICNR